MENVGINVIGHGIGMYSNIDGQYWSDKVGSDVYGYTYHRFCNNFTIPSPPEGMTKIVSAVLSFRVLDSRGSNFNVKAVDCTGMGDPDYGSPNWNCFGFTVWGTGSTSFSFQVTLNETGIAAIPFEGGPFNVGLIMDPESPVEYRQWVVIDRFTILPSLVITYAADEEPPTECFIKTLAAKYITKTSAYIGARYTGTVSVQAGWQWKYGNSWQGLYWWAHSPFFINSPREFWYNWRGLNAGRTYQYRAFIITDGVYDYGEAMSFKTDMYSVIFKPGYSYLTAKEAIDPVAALGLGRYYMDTEGNLQYESRFRRTAGGMG